MSEDAMIEHLADELRRYVDKSDLSDPFDKTTRECWEWIERTTRPGLDAEFVWGVVLHFAKAYHEYAAKEVAP